MTTATIKSTSRQGVTHTLYIHNEKAVGCTCEARQYNSNRECRHMTEFNAQVERDRTFAQLMSLYDSRKAPKHEESHTCTICGRALKSDSGVCGACIGY